MTETQQASAGQRGGASQQGAPFGRMLTTIRQREQREGIKLNLIKIPIPPKNINEITAAFERAITPRTRLIQIAHQINITGQITPVKAVCEMARARGCTRPGCSRSLRC